MKTKICTNKKCESPNRPLSEFNRDKYKNDGLKSWCKDCVKKYQKEYIEKFPWKIIFANIKQRCNNQKNKKYPRYGGRGIECRITVEELEKLWYRDKAWLLDQPSIDRKENNGHYTFENCKFIEMIENGVKDKRKSVLQFDLQTNFIKEWASTREIERELKFAHQNISACCKGEIITAYGFKWKYKLINSIIIMVFLFGIVSTTHARVDTNRAVIHHTVSGAWTTVADINKWHKENGWNGIGYHYVILANGEIKEGRSVLKNGAHKRGSNHLVGIALVGYDEFSEKQIQSLVKLLKKLNTKELERHHEKCPGNGINLNKILKEIK